MGQKDTEHHTEGDASRQGYSWNPDFPSLILQVDLEGEGRLDPARQGPKAKGQRRAHIVDLLIVGKLGTNKMVTVWAQQELSASYLGFLLGWDRGEWESLGCKTEMLYHFFWQRCKV